MDSIPKKLLSESKFYLHISFSEISFNNVNKHLLKGIFFLFHFWISFKAYCILDLVTTLYKLISIAEFEARQYGSFSITEYAEDVVLYYILNTPNLVGSGARLLEADMHRPIIFRVSAGSMMPSSQSLAVE